MGYKTANPAHRIGESRPSDCVGVQGLEKSAATRKHHNGAKRHGVQAVPLMLLRLCDVPIRRCPEIESQSNQQLKFTLRKYNCTNLNRKSAQA